MAYAFVSFFFRDRTTSLAQKGVVSTEGDDDGDRGCCRGIAHLELWGDAVKWGSEFKVKSSEECCRACKEMCKGVDGPCLCDSWVFCGDREACGSKFGEVFIFPLTHFIFLIGMRYWVIFGCIDMAVWNLKSEWCLQF